MPDRSNNVSLSYFMSVQTWFTSRTNKLKTAYAVYWQFSNKYGLFRLIDKISITTYSKKAKYIPFLLTQGRFKQVIKSMEHC